MDYTLLLSIRTVRLLLDTFHSTRINEYLKEYNQAGQYNFIFSTQEGNPTLYYKDTAFNITNDVVKGLNEKYKQSKKQ